MPTALNTHVRACCAVSLVLCAGGCGWLSDDYVKALRDGRIAANLHAAIHADPRLTGAEVSFRVEDGEVRIGGSTLTAGQRTLAAVIARDTVWVRRVVERDSRAARPATIQRASFDLLRDLSAVVALKQQLRAKGLGRHVEIDVEGGRVTLHGEVGSKAERRAIVATLRTDPEVNEIVDQTRISSEVGEDSDWRTAFDDSITTAQVRLALKLNKRLADQPVKVRTRRSHVTLRGSVDSAELAALAVQIAGDVPGVDDVSNELVVSEQSPRTADNPLHPD